MENEKNKRRQMRRFLLFVLVLIILNFIFNLNLPPYVWVVLFVLGCVLSIIQLMDTKLRALDERLKKLEGDED
jgi:Ca2+/Na+ antiporter